MAYCTTADVIRISGIYDQVINESVGTGDGSTTEFSLDNQKIVVASDKIYVDGAIKTRESHYTINEDRAIITFTPTQIPQDTEAVTADYKYIPPDLTNDDIDLYIEEADAYINEWTGKKFESSVATEWFEGRSEKISVTDSVKTGQFYEESDEEKRNIILSNYPVISITSVSYMDDDGTTVDTALTENTDYHTWTEFGKIRIFTTPKPKGKGKKKVRVIYTYGKTTVPKTVRELSATIAAIQCFTNLTGGSFDDITSYTLGPLSVGVGEPYMNMRAAIVELEKKKMNLLNAIGRKFRSVVV